MSKTNNTANKALLEAQEITAALKEGTEKSLRDLLNEAVSNIILESEEDETEETKEEKETEETKGEDLNNDGEFDVEDVETDETSDDADETPETDGEEEDTEGDDNDEWSDMEDYKVGDDEYDFTSADDEEVLKVYNKLGDDDQIMVTKTEDGKFEVTDGETGAEYVIDIDTDALETEDEPEEEGEFEIELGDEEPEEEPIEGDEELEIEFDDEEPEEEMLEETELGYTTKYQKDVMPGLKNDEPANASATYSMDAGAPKGTERPYSGYKKETGDPFVNENVDECGDMPQTELEEGAMTVSSQSVAKTTHTPTSEPRAKNKREVAKLVHSQGAYINESIKQLQTENKQYKECLDTIKKNLYEAFVTNVKLGHMLKLVCENTTSEKEKKSIIERYQSVSTIKESKTLYGTIKRELNEGVKTAAIIEHQIAAEPKSTLNETTIYQSIKENNPSLDLLNRMNNLWKK